VRAIQPASGNVSAVRETLELRIPEERAASVLAPNEGVELGSPPWIRKLTIPLDDPRALELDALASGWSITRSYTEQELGGTEVLHLIITSTFEPAGEECGTLYDESFACHYGEDETFPVAIPGGLVTQFVEQRCGAGRKQVSDLRLNLRKAPRGKDICRTIADEWILSDRFATLLSEMQATRFELRPVHHLLQVPPSTSWHQLTFTASALNVVPPTVTGNRPSDLDPAGKYRCPLGHVIGLNPLSEVHVSRNDWEGTDFAITRQYVGVRRGLLVPSPFILVSPRVRRAIVDTHVKGCRLEIAHLR
jgi:hypothetical protein